MVVDAQGGVVGAAPRGHDGALEPADHRHRLRSPLQREGEELGEHLLVKQILEDDLAATGHRAAVVRDERHVVARRTEQVLQGVERPPARDGEEHASLLEGEDALGHALGHRLVVGEQREVHVARHQANVREVVLEVASHRSSGLVGRSAHNSSVASGARAL